MTCAGSEELFDAQMLLHRLEEKFHFPSTFIQVTDRLSREGESVGEEHEPLARVRVASASVLRVTGPMPSWTASLS